MKQTCYSEILTDGNIQDYKNFFESCPNGLIQQSTYWSEIISPISPDASYFILTRDSESNKALAGLPLYFYQNHLGNILTSVPHAGPLGGVLILPDQEDDIKKHIYDQLLNKAINLAKDLNCIALTIITNPFINDVGYYTEAKKPGFIFENFSQAIYLPEIFDKNDDLIISQRNINRMLVKAEENGIKISAVASGEFDAWYQIHVQRHQDINVTPLPYYLLKSIVGA